VRPERQQFSYSELTPTQKAVGSHVIDILKETKDRKLVLYVKGLSGCGKSAMLEGIRKDISDLGADLLEFREFNELLFEKRFSRLPNQVITSVTPRDKYFYEDTRISSRPKLPSNFEQKEILMPGMTMEEIESLVRKDLPHNYSDLTNDQIAQYSLGIPLLIDKLSRTGIDERKAARISAGYLRNNLRFTSILGDIQKYFQIDIPKQAVSFYHEMSRSLSSGHIYDSLYVVLEQQSRLKEKGIVEPSPIFIAPESEKIYDKMLHCDDESEIKLFVPELEYPDFLRIQQAFGFKYGSYKQDFATRPDMFGANYRKVSFWHKSRFDEYHEQDEEIFKDWSENYLNEFKSGNLPLKSARRESASFSVDAWDHVGLVTNPTLMGWAVESLLQQRSIGYVVEDSMVDSTYYFNPETKHIESIR